MIESEFGQLVFIAGSIAEFGSILLLSLFFSKESSTACRPLSSPIRSINRLLGPGVTVAAKSSSTMAPGSPIRFMDATVTGGGGA